MVVLAGDDSGVASVYVTVRFLHGRVLEEGHSTRTDGWCTYRARADVLAARAVTIEVTAADLPGNRSTSNAAWTR